MLPDQIDPNHFLSNGSLPYLTILETLPGIHLVLSADLLIQSVSKDFLHAATLEREVIIGKYIWDVLYNREKFCRPEAILELKSSLKQVADTKHTHQMSLQPYPFSDPQKLGYEPKSYWLPTNIPLLDPTGQLVCIIHQIKQEIKPVTEEDNLKEVVLGAQQTYGQIQLENNSFHALFEQAPVAITLLQGENYIIEVANPAVLNIWGRSKEEVLGKPLFTAMPEIQNQGLEQLLAGVYSSGQPYVGHELPIELDRHGKKQKFHFNFVYHPLKNEKGISTGIAVVATDVSEQVESRKKVETIAAQLQLSNERLEEQVASRTLELQIAQKQAQDQQKEIYALFMSAPAGIALMKGPKLVYEMANQTFLNIVGRRESILGKPGREAFPEAVSQGIWDLIEGVYKSGEAFTGKEFKAMLDMDGNGVLKEQYYDFVFQPVKDVQGKVEAILVTALQVTEQVLARKVVEENAHYFSLLLESIPQMAWTATPDGQLDYFNSRWYAYTGQSQQQALGSGWIKVAHPHDVEACLPEWQHSLQSGAIYQVECRYRRSVDHMWRWHLVRAVALLDDRGTVLRWVGTCTDTHEQKLYTQQLLERETYFRQMANKVPVMIWVTRPDGYCTYLNKTWYDYTGEQREEALGLGWLNTIHPEDSPNTQEVFLTANTQQNPFSLLYRLRGKDGSYRWFLDKGEPSYDVEGSFEGFIGTVIDVHEQKLAEDRLLLSVKAGKVGIWEWDIVNNTATYSHLLQEMFGFKAGSLKENFEGAYQTYQRVIHPDDRQQVNEQVEKALKDAREEFYIEFRIVRPSGEIAWIAERGEVIFEKGHAIQMNGTCIDITSLKKAEEAFQHLSEELAAANEELAAANEELRAANEEIQAANEELSDSNQALTRINADLDNFVYTASHDLKAPILNIEGLLKRLERQLGRATGENKSITQIYELLYSSVARFKNTIRDLTEVARINKETAEDVATLPIEEILYEVKQDLDPQIKEAGATIGINLECPQIHFSRKNLKSILYNLLSNAVKYRSDDRVPLVQITCQTIGDYHVLSMQDNGLGMDMSQEDKIFALFKRLHSHVEGTGIGLYIVKRMVENAGGKIEVESQQGIGSTFKVYFKSY